MSRSATSGRREELGAAPFSVSVVIPLFNKEGSIAQTLESVLRQTRQPDEIVIVDDGSTDCSLERAKRVLADASLPIRVVTQPNAGVSVARNRGAAEARSRFISYLDGDDEWLPEYLAEIEKLAAAFPEATVLTTRNATASRNGALVPEPSPLPPDFFGMLDRPIEKFRRGRGVIHSSSVTLRKDAFERSGGFPVGARQGEDMYLWLKLGIGEPIAHSGRPLSIFRVEHSQADTRSAVVGYHFAYFLGTAEGRAMLANDDLRRFLASHLLQRIVFRRLDGHTEVNREHRRLASALPLPSAFGCWLLSIAPLWSLRALSELRRRHP